MDKVRHLLHTRGPRIEAKDLGRSRGRTVTVEAAGWGLFFGSLFSGLPGFLGEEGYVFES